MLKFFSKWAGPAATDGEPLDHPAIRAMSLDELADLPLTPRWPERYLRSTSPCWNSTERRL